MDDSGSGRAAMMHRRNCFSLSGRIALPTWLLQGNDSTSKERNRAPFGLDSSG
jgi:hypothetical protein